MVYIRLAVAVSAAVAANAQKPIDFQREVRPILSSACFQCHGPDKGTRMADLRLDTKDGLFSERKSGVVILPGKPASSLLVQRINHAQGALRMPPAASKKLLTPEQRGLLEKWIAQGAPWKGHWAFAAPVRPTPPAVGGAWAKNQIDKFVLKSLAAAGLQPAPQADNRTLIRRASLDTTGLPPSPADLDAFLKDSSPNAYDKLVDRLLASKRYGEHRSRYWLDAARYADTHGLHVDNYREMWPYRDWVISAFNRNVPFDKFTIEQVAGDLLPNRTVEQQIASGFHRCNVTTNEGGSIPDEVAAIYAKDRVETTGTVWLGLTVGCASCHDHKFDPVSQREFYQFAAFFRNTTQNPMDGNIPDTPPILFVPKPQDEARWHDLRAQVARLGEAKQQRRESITADFDAWASKRQLPGEPLDTDALALKVVPADGIAVGAGPSANVEALHFGEKAAVNVPAPAGFDPAEPFTIAAWVLMPKGEDGFTVASQSVPQPAKKKDDDDDDAVVPQGWAIEISGRIPSLRLGGTNSIRVSGNNIDRLKPGTWTHVVFTYDGQADRRGLNLYVNGKPSGTANRDNPELKGSPSVNAPIRFGGEARRYFNGGAIADFRIYNRVVNADEAAVLASWNKVRDGSAGRDTMLAFYANRFDGPYRELQGRLVGIEAERQAIARRAAITHVMEEKRDTMPEANILFRGQYDQPRDKVTANTPSVLPPMPEAFPRNRLGLAQWLVDPMNPLTARVTVNRMWQELFGSGLVKTAEDFGSQGLPPSHPELLDWLAVEFRESGWDMKHMYGLMLKSATYRQSAAATESKLRADPDNKLLSRGPRFRMDGEMVRDLFLDTGGLLGSAIGGPSVKPYQPDGIWETVAMKGSNTRFYKRDSGDSLYRRSLYTFWKRSAPPPSMEIFNAPTRENCTVRRERTNTPLQALVTMNDPQLVEASRKLAERALSTGAGFDSRLDAITVRSLSRQFNPRERGVIRRELADLMSHYDSRPEEARRLLGIGDSKAAGLAPAELAAWTMVASSVLNLDEALNK